MNTIILEISIILALAIIFFIFLRKLPKAKQILKNPPILNQKTAQSKIKPQKVKIEPEKQILESLSKTKTLIENNQLRDAEKILLRIIVEDPHNGEIYENLGLIYLKQTNFSDAIAAFLEALKYKKDRDGNLYNNLGLAYFNLQEYPKSIENYRRAIELDREATTRYINLALAQKAFAHPSDAKRTLERAQKLDPENPDIKKLLIALEKKS